MRAFVLAKSTRGPVLFSVDLLNQLREAWRNRQPNEDGLRDSIEWEDEDGNQCYYYEEPAGLSDYWEYSCGGEFYQGGGGVWSGFDAWGNYYAPTYSGGDLGGATVSASSGPLSPVPIDWSQIASSIPGSGGPSWWQKALDWIGKNISVSGGSGSAPPTGARAGTQANNQPPRQLPPQQKDNTLLWLALIVGGVIVLSD